VLHGTLILPLLSFSLESNSNLLQGTARFSSLGFENKETLPKNSHNSKNDASNLYYGTDKFNVHFFLPGWSDQLQQQPHDPLPPEPVPVPGCCVGRH
jgi:hypothetical protein